MILLTIAVRPQKLIGAREMNKRIEKLIVQAGNYVNETYTGPVPTTFTGNPVWHKEFDKWTQFNEKFAELIVRECLSIVDDAERGGSNEVWDNAVKFIRRDLKEHFGVEE